MFLHMACSKTTEHHQSYSQRATQGIDAAEKLGICKPLISDMVLDTVFERGTVWCSCPFKNRFEHPCVFVLVVCKIAPSRHENAQGLGFLRTLVADVGLVICQHRCMQETDAPSHRMTRSHACLPGCTTIKGAGP